MSSSRYHLPDEECIDRPALRALQLLKFRALSDALGDNAFYRAKFAAAGVDPAAVRDWEAFRALPFTSKDELCADQAAHPPYGTALGRPLEAYTRLHQTSGTQGTPLRWLDTPANWAWFQRCWGIIYAATGITPQDRVFFPFSFGPFIGFWAAFEGAQALGCLCISGGGMSTAARLEALREHGATVVCCTPTYALRMVQTAEEQGMDLAACEVRALIVAGEPGGAVPAVRARIEAGWGARVFDHTGMTEIGSLGIECEADPGNTMLIESECIAEVVDPETGAAQPGGMEGELVLTNLGRVDSPLIRYRTGDLVQLDTSPCPCGRGYARMRGGILARRDDMLFIRGNNVYPAVIENVIRGVEGIAEFRLVVARTRDMNELTIELELAPDSVSREAEIIESVCKGIANRYYFRPVIVPVEAGTLPRFELKARRLVFRD